MLEIEPNSLDGGLYHLNQNLIIIENLLIQPSN